MKENRRTQVLFGVLGFTILMGGVYFALNRPGKKPEPSAEGYYTGPMRPKGGNRDVVADEGGNVTVSPMPKKAGEEDKKAPAKDAKTAGPKQDGGMP
jgi:hypothetical protein